MSENTEQEESVLNYGFNFNKLSDAVKVEDEENSESDESKEEIKDESENTEAETDKEGKASADESADEKTVEEDVKDIKKDSVSEAPEPETQNEYGKLINQYVTEGLLEYDPDKEYEESEQGLNDLIAENFKKKQEEAIEKFKSELPDESKELIDFINKGGNVKDFIDVKETFIDYDSMVVATMDDGEKEALVGFLLENQGLSDDLINSQIEAFKSTGKLDDVAETARKSLKTLQDKELSDKEAANKVKTEQEATLKQEKEAQFKNTVTNTRELKGIKLSENDANELHDYITKSVNSDKQTQYALDDDEESRLFYAYLKMKKFDFKKLEAKAERKVNLKFKKNIDNSNSVGNSKSTSTQVDRNEEVTNSIPNQQKMFTALKAATKQVN